MDKYFVEVPHEPTKTACMYAINIFLRTGSHFLAQAEWGCLDGEHKAWLIVEAEDKDEIRRSIPSPFRSKARIVKLHRFTREEMDSIEETHPA